MRKLAIITALLLIFALPAMAAEVDCDSVYCFSPADFSEEGSLAGICILSLPEEGSVTLGDRVLQPGDILTVSQVETMTYTPVWSEGDAAAAVSYLPIYPDRVEGEQTMTIAVKGKLDQAPAAEDCAAETYRNLPVEGLLKVSDPEEGELTYTVTRQPKRGEVIIRQDGSFLYTPKKNKVGVDSFRFTATDSAGNVSREATVTVTVLKPTDAPMYTDTTCFEAEWLKHTGIFTGETLGGEVCFQPEKTVTQGEFLSMLVGALELQQEEVTELYEAGDVPKWLQPYAAAALRAGLTAGLPQPLDCNAPITGSEAAVLLCNALSLTAEEEAAGEEAAEIPVWAADPLAAAQENGFALSADMVLTRQDAAKLLYQVRCRKEA